MEMVAVVEEEGAVVIAAEAAVVLLTSIAPQERLILTRKFTRAGEATKAALNSRPRRLEILMPRLRALPLPPMAGMPCRLTTPGVHHPPRRRIPGGQLLLRAITPQLLKTRKLAMITSQGKENLKKKITPSPSTNTLHN
jgi:hypothetical protein